MLDRDYLESKDNWQATFRYTTPHPINGITFDCLMRCASNPKFPQRYYWHTPDYQGMFAWGATREFNARTLARSLERGYIVLESGELPAEVAELLKPKVCTP